MAGPVAGPVARRPLPMAGAEDVPEDLLRDVLEDGAEDGFYERFAAELEVLAELGGGRCCGAGTGGGGGKERALRARVCPPRRGSPPLTGTVL